MKKTVSRALVLLALSLSGSALASNEVTVITNWWGQMRLPSSKRGDNKALVTVSGDSNNVYKVGQNGINGWG